MQLFINIIHLLNKNVFSKITFQSETGYWMRKKVAQELILNHGAWPRCVFAKTIYLNNYLVIG